MSGVNAVNVRVLDHARLTSGELANVRRMFDAEYRQEHGEWNPEQPYGYAPHSVHVVAELEGIVIGHVGFASRTIMVGGAKVMIAGVGGVLVAPPARGKGVASRLMTRAVQAMRSEGTAEFGYLGCREEVVPFYASCGWRRIYAEETSINRVGDRVITPAGEPLMVRPLRSGCEWPKGPIDLRGRAW